ncbi:MAG: aldo/keto reductase [Cuniculiplasma sp.]
MNVKKLGNTGTLVSELCLGTMTFGWQANESQSHEILDYFTENGGNFIDTANVYSNGKSETIIGEWLKNQDRESIVLATKARFRMSDHANGVGLSRKHLIHSLRESLTRLNTDYVDLFQLHTWDQLTPLEETLSTLNKMVNDGLVRYIGISNFRAWQFEKALQLCRSKGWEEPVSIQPHYNIFVRGTEFEILPMALNEKIAVLPWSPLAGGYLSGKYRSGVAGAPKGTRIGDSNNPDFYSKFDGKRGKSITSTVEKVAEKNKRTMAQVSLNWLLQNPAVTSPIIGARNLDQLKDDLGATEFNLSNSDIDRINRASQLEVTYPYDDRAEDQQISGRELP